jgi:polysaccharide biosynthesis/export protein
LVPGKRPMIRLNFLSLLAASLLTGLAACTDRQPLLEPTPTLTEPYRLDSGDQLRIVVYDQPSLTNLYDVDQAGEVAFPLIGDIEARAATSEELARRIETRLAMGFLREPDVTVEVATYRPFFVLGEVGDPGQYPYVPGITAETAIAVAGGFTERANKRLVRISRTIGDARHEARIPVTELIRPGDTIYVPESLF